MGVIPPLWHRHPELIWELSALRQHWLSAYDPKQHGSAPTGWHRDFADAKQRLHDWVAACGTRLDSDRPTRQAAWPGEDPAPTVEESAITNRDEDFVQFVRDAWRSGDFGSLRRGRSGPRPRETQFAAIQNVPPRSIQLVPS